MDSEGWMKALKDALFCNKLTVVLVKASLIVLLLLTAKVVAVVAVLVATVA